MAVYQALSGPFLFVGHSASCVGIVSAFDPLRFGPRYVGYTSLSCFRRPEGGGWSLIGTLGDVAHLSDKHAASSLASAFSKPHQKGGGLPP